MSKELKDTTVHKNRNHDHFWIDDGRLYESYRTIRGMRFVLIMKVPGMPDNDNCNAPCLNYIAKEYTCK